jgi:hypothetical protein
MRLELSQLQLVPHKLIIIIRLELSQLQLKPHQLIIRMRLELSQLQLEPHKLIADPTSAAPSFQQQAVINKQN